MSIFKSVDLPQAKAAFNPEKREFITSIAMTRYFKGLSPELNDLNGKTEYSCEILIDKADKEGMKQMLRAIDDTVSYQVDPKNNKTKADKANAMLAKENYEEALEKFNSGTSNVMTVKQAGKKIEMETGEFSVIENGDRLFHFPIRDGDLVIRKRVDDDGVTTYVKESEQEIGKGGEVKGCWIVRVKLESTRKAKDGSIIEQAPHIINRRKVKLTAEELEEFVSLDFGRFKFRPYCYKRSDGAGVTFYWTAAQHVLDGEHRILPNGSGSSDPEDGFDDLDEDDWDE